MSKPDGEFPEPDWWGYSPIQHYGERFGLIVTFNTRLFWAWHLDRTEMRTCLHFCAGPLEVSAWRNRR